MKKFFFRLTFLGFLSLSNVLFAENNEFNLWLKDFKLIASEKGISQKTIALILNDVIFLDKVIVYDNRQPEFFEKTKIYIGKRATARAAKEAKKNIKLTKISLIK